MFYKVKNDKERGDYTSFCLKEGSTFELGSETVELEEDTCFIIRRPLQRDAIVDLIVSSGNASVNSVNFPFKETRDGVHYDVKYGGRGQRIETVVEKGAARGGHAYTEAEAIAQNDGVDESTAAKAKASTKAGVLGRGTKSVKIENDPKPGSEGFRPAGQVRTGDSAFPGSKVGR